MQPKSFGCLLIHTPNDCQVQPGQNLKIQLPILWSEEKWSLSLNQHPAVLKVNSRESLPNRFMRLTPFHALPTSSSDHKSSLFCRYHRVPRYAS